MSVIVAKRKEGRFEVLLRAEELCAYTIRICKNEKNFPKRDRWILTQPIVNEALAAMTCIRRGNAVRVVQQSDYEYRRSQQVEAFAHLEALLSLIEIAYNVLSIESKRIEFWTGLVLGVEEKLRGWRRSDREGWRASQKGDSGQ